MDKYLQIVQFLDSNNIDPYNVLNIPVEEKNSLTKQKVKEYYKMQILKVHPDKNKSKDDTDFKILQICYYHLVHTLKTYKEVKAETEVPVYKNQTDYTNNESRRAVFANDTLDFNIDYSRPMSTSYSADNVNIPRKINHTRNFDINKFNEDFEKNKIQNLSKLPNISYVPANTTLRAMPISCYNGLIVDNPNKKIHRFNYINEEEELANKMSNIDFTTSPSDLHKKINQREEVRPDTSLSFNDGILKMEQDKILQMKSQIEENKKNIMNNLHIFPEDLVEKFNNNLLEDSSTVIKNNRFILPTGTRKE